MPLYEQFEAYCRLKNAQYAARGISQPELLMEGNRADAVDPRFTPMTRRPIVAQRPDSFKGMDLTSPQNRLPAGKTALAANVRAYTEGGFALRNGLGLPIITVDFLHQFPLPDERHHTDRPRERLLTTSSSTRTSASVFRRFGGAGGYRFEYRSGFSSFRFAPTPASKPWAYIADTSDRCGGCKTKYALERLLG